MRKNICELCSSISDTYKNKEEKVVLINTSDVYDGKCTNHTLVENKQLRGQFKKTFKPNDILYSEIRPANRRFAYIDFDTKNYIASTKLMVLRAKEGVSPKYLYQILRGNSTINALQLLAESRSGTFPQITFSELSNIEVNIPSEDVQNMVVSILSSLDAKIETNNKLNEKLEEMAQAIFKSWFVDFEPFKNQPFYETELGMIPEGWEVKTVDEFCRIFTGKKNTNQSDANGIYPFFSCAPDPLRSNDYLYDGYAVIIAGNGSYTGRTQLYNGKFDLYQRTYACVAKEKFFNDKIVFIYLMMKHGFEREKMGGTRGSSIPYIVMNDIAKQTFCYNKNVIGNFCNIVRPVMDFKHKLQIESARLASLRDTLLPRLMSGEIKI